MSDLISRQAAIDLWEKYHPTIAVDVMQYDAELRELPTAKPEIIRCKDCKHRDPEDKKCDCGHGILWQLPREDNWYCADAERREDE